MNIGMLWFDNDPKAELTAKVERAALYYRNKYGKAPTLYFVHPTMLANARGQAQTIPEGESMESYRAAGVEVRPTRSILPNHLWIGVNGKAQEAAK